MSVPTEYLDTYEDFQKEIQTSCLKIKLPNGKVMIPFYTYHIKKTWAPCRASLELFVNWLGFWITIISFWSSSPVWGYIGAGALMLGQINLHFWYGYLKHPNPARTFIAWSSDDFADRFEENDAEFEDIRNHLSVLYHGGRSGVDNTQDGVKCAGFFIRLVNDLVALSIAIAVSVSIFVSYVFSVFVVEDANGRPAHEVHLPLLLFAIAYVVLLSDCLVECSFASSGIVAAVGGSFIWCITYLMADFAIEDEDESSRSSLLWLRFFAMIMLFLLEEFYTALLFRKDFKDFATAALLQIFYDVIGELEVVGELADNPHSALDIESLDKPKSPKDKVKAQDGESVDKPKSSKDKVEPSETECNEKSVSSRSPTETEMGKSDPNLPADETMNSDSYSETEENDRNLANETMDDSGSDSNSETFSEFDSVHVDSLDLGSNDSDSVYSDDDASRSV